MGDGLLLHEPGTYAKGFPHEHFRQLRESDPITHQGEAVGYLLEGEIELLIDGTTYHMKTGDSFFFKAHLANGYRNTGSTLARIVWVNTPQIH